MYTTFISRFNHLLKKKFVINKFHVDVEEINLEVRANMCVDYEFAMLLVKVKS